MGQSAEGGEVMEILTMDQGSGEWHAAKLGIPSASRFKDVLAKGEGKVRSTYMRKLAGEILTGEPMDSFSNGHMDRGKEMEDEARELYAFVKNGPSLQRVGFIRSGNKGCSPDSLIGENGALEIKTELPHLLIDTIIADNFPAEHKAQCQGVLWTAERDWIDIGIFWPKLPLFVKNATRDEAYITKLSEAVDAFNEELALMVQKIKAYGGLT
jgi:hypothetical protein